MRNLKGLGLALLATFAISAMAASVAGADEFTVESSPATLTGKSSGLTDRFTTTGGSGANCTNPTYHGAISGSTTAMTLTPDYHDGTCTAFGFPGTIKVNGCQYVFFVLSGNWTMGDVDLVCPAGKELTITGLPSNPKCTAHIKGQNDIGGLAKYSGIGTGLTREITIEANLDSIDYTHTEGTGVGSCSSGSGTFGTLKIFAVIKAETLGTGSHVGLLMSI